MRKEVNLLFIGNSHTYMHDLPHMVTVMAEECGYDCRVAMIAHGGWYLWQHTEESDVRFNINYGKYDYVILQEHSHPFDCIDDYFRAAATLNDWIKSAGARTVIYGTWSMKDQPQEQERMNRINRELANDLEAVYAPVGENWWQYLNSYPDIEMYEPDGAHASSRGVEFAAKIIWESVYTDISRRKMQSL